MTAGITGNTSFPNSSRLVSGAYLITCLPNQMAYAGSSRNVYQRWQGHRKQLRAGRHSLDRLQADWNEFGADQFLFSIESAIEGEDALYDAEQSLIDMLMASGRAYNILPYARLRGSRLANSTRQKLRTYVRSEATRGRMSASARARTDRQPLTEAHKASISAANRGSGHGLSLFTEEQVLAIRERLNAGEPGRQIALSLGVSPATINDIKLRRTWKHI